MSDIQKYPIKERQIGDWSNVAELIDYKIVRTIKGGLLGTQMADVLFIYKKKFNQSDVQQKRLHLYGEEGVVFKRSLDVIMRKKNERQRHEMMNKFTDEFNLTKFTTNQTTSPGTLLGRAIENTGYTARQFAEKTGIKAPSLYHHVSGGREISREIAIEYADKLNCDPVDLMFDKKMCPVWAKVDLLKPTELEDTYNPGRLFSYAIEDKDFENVVVPRDLYREDVENLLKDLLEKENSEAGEIYIVARQLKNSNEFMLANMAYKAIYDRYKEDLDGNIIAEYAQTLFLSQGRKFNNDIDNILDDALKKNPLNPSALTLKGLSELEKNNPDLTIEYWNKTLPLLGSQKEKTELIGLIEAVKKRKNQ